MCTVSFLPGADGFFLAMNRDEQLSRRSALPPELFPTGSHHSIYPREISGGTWMGVNEAGLALALINWYAQPQLPGPGLRSRGEIIPALLAASTLAEASSALTRLPLANTNPFRLILASLRENQLAEAGWNGRALSAQPLPWETHHWFSSGHNEAAANHQRQLTCARAAQISEPDSITWLRCLHRSHHPKKDALSICMHRADACTVSYNELSVTPTIATILYIVGPPCEHGPTYTRSLPLPPRNVRPGG